MDKGKLCVEKFKKILSNILKNGLNAQDMCEIMSFCHGIYVAMLIQLPLPFNTKINMIDEVTENMKTSIEQSCFGSLREEHSNV